MEMKAHQPVPQKTEDDMSNIKQDKVSSFLPDIRDTNQPTVGRQVETNDEPLGTQTVQQTEPTSIIQTESASIVQTESMEQ